MNAEHVRYTMHKFPALKGNGPRGRLRWFTPMTPAETFDVARISEPKLAGGCDPNDPQGLNAGARAAITPLTDSGDAPVEGTIRAVGRDTIVTGRENVACGAVSVHFPRAEYRVTLL